MIHEHGTRPYEWVGRLSEKRATLTPERVGLVDATTGTEYTYADLDRRANRTVRLLREAGVGEGDRVAVVSRNRPAMVDLYFATAKLGAVLAPLSHRLAPPELAGLLDDVAPAALLGEAPFLGDLRAALTDEAFEAETPPLVALGAAEDTKPADPVDGRAWTAYADRPADDSAVETADVGLDDPHLFLHTGGSTGLPKEVVQTHGGIAWNAFNTVTSWGLRADDVTPMVFPMFHTGGWNVLTVPFFHLGATVVVAREFEPGEVLDLLERRACSVLVAVPAVLRFMTEHDRWAETDLSSVRLAKSGGGPCRDSVIEAWADRGVELTQGYGLTECGPNNFATPEGTGSEKSGSIGVPALYVDTRIVDEDGESVERGEVGELELAGPVAGDGYWDNPEETEATFGGGWVSTGDLARVDEDGYYYIEGRKKNMFVSGGENVYPPEVENVLADHPKVQEVVVVPVEDDTWGEVGKAVVQGEESLTLEELQAFAEGRLAGFKLPRHLAFIEEMPTSGPSKIDRGAVETEFGG